MVASHLAQSGGLPGGGFSGGFYMLFCGVGFLVFFLGFLVFFGMMLLLAAFSYFFSNLFWERRQSQLFSWQFFEKASNPNHQPDD